MKDSPFFKAAALMVRILPHVMTEECFALKGGTAINFFLRDLPRLSVDIDLTYLLIESREKSLINIDHALQRISDSVKSTIPGIRVTERLTKNFHRATKLFIRNEEAQIRIEPNEILRGSLFPCQERNLSKTAEELFKISATAHLLSTADLYAGKLCAALDRQHPRDLFDIKILLENEGITDEIRKSFVIYLASSDRPMSELIDPVRKDIRPVYEKGFLGMTSILVKYEELLSVRETFITILNKELTDQERRFLLSVKQGEPKWNLMETEGIKKLPAVQWKLLNIQRMDKKKHAESIQKLQAKLKL